MDVEILDSTISISESENEVNASSSSQESFLDFTQPAKRSKPNPTLSPNKSEDLKDSNATDPDDGELCPICFDTWTTSGEHRLCCLKCGHLFGYSCIDKWLASKNRDGSCPQCNAKASRSHIRLLYSKRLKVLDTSERDQAISRYEKERRQRQKLEMEAADLRLKFQMSVEEARSLRDQLGQLQRQLSSNSLETSSSLSRSNSLNPSVSTADQIVNGGKYRYDAVKSVLLSESGRCRVMAGCDYLETLCVSQPSNNPLFKGYGVRKINYSTQRAIKYLPIHQDTIRDLAFSSQAENGLLASASLDKTIKLTTLLTDRVNTLKSINAPQQVQSYECSVPVWSCVWSTSNRNHLFAGLGNGSVLQFDIRNLGDPVMRINEGRGRSPVVSLHHLPQNPHAHFRPGGLFVAQLDKISFFQESPSQSEQPDYHLNALPVQGPLVWLDLEPTSRHILTTLRPSLQYPSVRHFISELKTESREGEEEIEVRSAPLVCTTSHVRTLTGGRTMKLLSRSRLFFHPVAGLMVAAGDEELLTVTIWKVNNGERLQVLYLRELLCGTTEPPMDLITLDKFNLLAVISEKNACFYRLTC